MKYKFFNIPIYDVDLCVVRFSDAKRLKKLFDKNDFDMPDSVARNMGTALIGGVKKKHGTFACIYLVFNESEAYHKITAGLIAHECLHAVDFVYEIIDAHHDARNPEPSAYLMEWIVNTASDFISSTNE